MCDSHSDLPAHDLFAGPSELLTLQFTMEQINIYSGKDVISRILIDNDVETLGSLLEPYKKVYAVMDRSVAMDCPASVAIADILNAKGAPGMLVEASEQEKTMETVMKICSWLMEQGADRDALVLAVGGGITTDITGFAASIYKRGVRFAYMPTTLLAQVDAAVGGKTGVNVDNYKNMLGVIRQPKFTFICPQVLESLPSRDLLSGAAEMLKTFIIEDGGWYDKAVEWLKGYSSVAEDEKRAYLNENVDELATLVGAAVSVKAGIVTRDQFEGGERRKLNLGHTFAHAIETLAQWKRQESDDAPDITHGEAVAMGIVLAAELSDSYKRRNGEMSEPEDAFGWGLEQRLEADFLSCGLPIGCPFKLSHMAEVMKKDKKAEGGKVHFVLPMSVGDVSIVDFTVDEVLGLMSVK